MATIKNLEVGQVLWEIKRCRCGNTTMKRNAIFPVQVVSIAEDGLSIMASWNHNPPHRYREKDVAKLRVNKPYPKGKVFGMNSY